jgi:hypothetical protein
MSAYYTPAEIQALSQDVLRVHTPAAIRAAYAMFAWQGGVLPHAWTVRDALCAPLRQAVRAGSHAKLEVAAAEVHQWGFGQPILPAVIGNPKFLPALLEALVAFDGATPPYTSMRESALVELLSIPDLGIARASKWVCFIDQSRFGIFDSRVSIALRDVHLADQRAFPIMGRRPVVGQQSFSSDTHVLADPRRTARAYLDYLAVLSSVAREVRLDAAEVEMALFMIGDVWATGQPPLRSLRRSMWK